MGVQLIKPRRIASALRCQVCSGRFDNVLSLQGLAKYCSSISDRTPYPRPQFRKPQFLATHRLDLRILLCVRRGAFMLSGQFDPAFFLYFEEFVLCHQLRKYGKLAIVRGLQCTHVGGGSSDRSEPKHNIAQHHISCLYSIKVRYGRLLVLANYLLFIIECFVLPWLSYS